MSDFVRALENVFRFVAVMGGMALFVLFVCCIGNAGYQIGADWLRMPPVRRRNTGRRKATGQKKRRNRAASTKTIFVQSRSARSRLQQRRATPCQLWTRQDAATST